VVLLDALKTRSKMFHNRNPEEVRHRVELVEKAIDRHYAHLPATARPA
jgi:hypothetical protein